ncbi:hypothetical protein LEP1GSC170_4637, partial [Leptospira interrogans serovar Bataviae str. HAI135]
MSGSDVVFLRFVEFPCRIETFQKPVNLMIGISPKTKLEWDLWF